MSNETYYKINPDGRIYRRTNVEVEVNIADEVLATLQSGVPTRVRAMFDSLSKNPVVKSNVVFKGNNHAFVTSGLSELVIKAPFRMEGEYLMPYFNSKEDPIMSIPWKNPADMWLYLCVSANYIPADPYRGLWGFSQAYLFALGPIPSSGKPQPVYRLPLPNIYDDARICMGPGQSVAAQMTLHDLLKTTHQVLVASQWGVHFLKDKGLTDQLFRFKPLKDGFETIPPANAQWWKVCEKIATDITANYLFP